MTGCGVAANVHRVGLEAPGAARGVRELRCGGVTAVTSTIQIIKLPSSLLHPSTNQISMEARG